MTDLHSHILYGIDDGVKTLDDAINTIINMKNVGFDNIVLTPHYIEGTNFDADNKLKKERFNKLKEELLKRNIKVNLFLANEIYISGNIIKLINDNKISSINNSKYLLIEFPLHNEINMVDEYIHELKVDGYVPIIAHPERYKYFQEDYAKMENIYDEGALFQCNYGSIIKLYGKEAYKLLKYMLKNDMVSFLGTDIHNQDSNVLKNFDKIKRKIVKITSEEKFDKLSNKNILKIVKNQ